MAEFQRKIELQSQDDLQYLVSNIRRAAREKIDMDLPPMEGEDPMRRRVEDIVSQYVNSVVQAMSRNISINGLEPSPELLDLILSNSSSSSPTAIEIEEHEPFNTRLFERAKDLARQEEDLTEEIAALRRTVPARVAETVRRDFSEGIERDEATFEELGEHLQLAEASAADLGVVALERQEQVERVWERGVKGLEGLMKSLPEMIAKKERAEMVEQYVSKGDGP